MWYCCYYHCGFIECGLLDLPLSNLKEMICPLFDAKAVVPGHVYEKSAEKNVCMMVKHCRKTMYFFATNTQLTTLTFSSYCMLLPHH